ncbi:N-acetyl-D-glucosamine kinase domain protein [Candidatus Erwinia dacicola]|uniref:N-acetyl-D-glucosamine kinase domain protein n=1 Tax=Candidatus Erwinia dacicola TaxID=252393 RepID=A0A328TKR2_9GAMM|nr:N-acetyl-D-glucosamine kinase domain protein [Candidatus Erwinia dacicola]
MYYGFDIGGSKIALGVYDTQRQLVWQHRVVHCRMIIRSCWRCWSS